MRRLRRLTGFLILGCCLTHIALAGPPYVADDPEPTDERHYEIYLYSSGDHNDAGNGRVSGIDFNYGAAPDLQLTAVLPVAYDQVRGESNRTGVGNVELAAKYRFLHQVSNSWDVAIFPRVLLPSASKSIGDQHASMLIPIWLERDWNDWSTFGGGGCAINQGGDSRNYCMAAWALARQILPALRVGAEVQHQTPDTREGHASTGIGAGIEFDTSDHCHLLGYYAPGVQNPAQTVRYSYYIALLVTF